MESDEYKTPDYEAHIKRVVGVQTHTEMESQDKR
jgi:hypothetical protein